MYKGKQSLSEVAISVVTRKFWQTSSASNHVSHSFHCCQVNLQVKEKLSSLLINDSANTVAPLQNSKSACCAFVAMVAVKTMPSARGKQILLACDDQITLFD